MIENIYTLYTKFDEIVRDLDCKLKLDFEPNFYFLFLTESTWKLYDKVLRFLKKRFPNCKMSGCIVEGYVTREGAWTRGLALLFFEKGVDVVWAKGKTAEEIFTRLKRTMKNWSSAITIFPLFRFGNRWDMIHFSITNNTVWRYRYWRAKDLRAKIDVLERYSKILEERYVFPANKALRVFDGDKPVIGLNLLPLEAGFGTPLIFANYQVLGRSCAGVCFRGKTNAIFHDVFPERGKSYEETVEILKNLLPSVREVEVVKKGVVIGEVEGISAVEFLKKERFIQTYNEKETVKMLEEEKLRTVSPYGLAFISKETFGSSILGLLPYQLSIYPSLFDLDVFYDKALFVGEYFRGGIRSFEGLFKMKKYDDSFDFFMIDANVIPMFGGRCFEIKKMADEFCKDYFGVFSADISFRYDSLEKNYLSEIEKGLCFMTSGTSAMVEIKSP
ncbi:FIST N-terminal domain-containing protein [Archaeoglobus sp.]